MHILHVIRHIQNAGNGGVNAAINLACLQAKAGHKVGVASGEGSYKPLLENYGIEYFPLNHTNKLNIFIDSIKQFNQTIHTFKPNIVHAHTMLGTSLGKLYQWRYRYSLVATVHNEFQRSAILMKIADRVITTTKACAESMHRRGTPKNKIRIIPLGTIGSPRTHPLQDYCPLPLHRPAITTVAGICQRKGIYELIDAFKQIADEFPNAHLYLVGEGSDRPLLENQIRDSLLAQRIHFEGFQPEPQKYLLSTDIFVLASHREPFGLALAEAREAGCAVIGSNVDGIPEVLENGQAGILIPPGNSAALAKEITKLLGDSSLLGQWKERAQSNLHWLSVEREHQEVIALYNELVADH